MEVYSESIETKTILNSLLHTFEKLYMKSHPKDDYEPEHTNYDSMSNLSA